LKSVSSNTKKQHLKPTAYSLSHIFGLLWSVGQTGFYRRIFNKAVAKVLEENIKAGISDKFIYAQ
jgi:hypothetical protein